MRRHTDMAHLGSVRSSLVYEQVAMTHLELQDTHSLSYMPRDHEQLVSCACSKPRLRLASISRADRSSSSRASSSPPTRTSSPFSGRGGSSPSASPRARLHHPHDGRLSPRVRGVRVAAQSQPRPGRIIGGVPAGQTAGRGAERRARCGAACHHLLSAVHLRALAVTPHAVTAFHIFTRRAHIKTSVLLFKRCTFCSKCKICCKTKQNKTKSRTLITGGCWGCGGAVVGLCGVCGVCLRRMLVFVVLEFAFSLPLGLHRATGARRPRRGLDGQVEESGEDLMRFCHCNTRKNRPLPGHL